MQIKFFNRKLVINTKNGLGCFYNNLITKDQITFYKIILRNNRSFFKNLEIEDEIKINHTDMHHLFNFYNLLNFSKGDEINIEIFKNDYTKLNIENESLYLFKDFSIVKNWNQERKFFNIDYNINEAFFCFYNLMRLQQELNPNFILSDELENTQKRIFSEEIHFLQIWNKYQHVFREETRLNITNFFSYFFGTMKRENIYDFYFKPLKSHLEKSLFEFSLPHKLQRKNMIPFFENNKIPVIKNIWNIYTRHYEELFKKMNIKNCYYEEEFEDILELIKKINKLDNINFKKIEVPQKIINKTSLKEVLKKNDYFKSFTNFSK